MIFFRRYSLLIAIVMAVQAAVLTGQPTSMGDVSVISIDAFSTKGDELRGTASCDIFVQVPFQTLQFQSVSEKFAAQYRVVVTVRDTSGRRLFDTSYTQSVVEDSYSITKGSTGKSDRTISKFHLKPEFYRVDVSVLDNFSQREYTQSKRISIPDFTITPSMSSLLYLSEIEQRGSRYSITPYIGDAIRPNLTTLFAFFEIYEDELPKNVFSSWKITSADGRVLNSGVTDQFHLTKRTSQSFVPIKLVRSPLPGTYSLTVYLNPEKNGVADTSEIYAQFSKPYIVPGSHSGNLTADINKAIRQLIYVASQIDIDSISAPADIAEKQYRFNEFWKTLDPTPNTIRNEAFDDYYGRIETANRRYKSYSEGWLTDMGRVYIIFGDPTNIDRYVSQNNTVQNVRWVYGNRFTLIFEDNTGFGDYRLRTPLPPGSKYHYR